MTPSFTTTDPQSHAGKTNVWLTPPWILDALGPFDLDPCAAPNPRPFPTATRMFTEADGDGLKIPWEGRVWLNPPYGKHAIQWLKKLDSHGNGIALIFNRLDTCWLQDFIQNKGIFFTRGRIKFLRPDGLPVSNPGVGSILIPFGQQNKESILKSGIKGLWKE